MKHAFKKIIAMLLVVMMIVGILPSVFAADYVDGQFADVKDTDWFAPYVEYVFENGLMSGTSENTFSPNGNTTRAQAAVVLYRMSGETFTGGSSFTDLVADWYKDAVAWAEFREIVTGVAEGIFRPDGQLTRAQLVTMVWRYALEPEVEEDYLAEFPDKDDVPAWAAEAFNWAISVGIIGGSDGKLIPNKPATRVQYAKIISVFHVVLNPCKEHTWDKGKVTKEATCTEEGEMLYTCTRCGATKTEVIPMAPHSYVDGVCSACGDALAAEGDIVIYYTNDVHTYINGALSYDSIADLKTQTAAIADGVLLVDAGDHIQGTAYGSMDKGASIISLMNAAGYDYATLGNHEFDYGMERALEIAKGGEADFQYLSANFYNEKDGVVGDAVLAPYAIEEIDGVKIAIVGITTPETFTKSTPKYFQDAEGNYIYGIAGGEDGAALYASVQVAIDAAKREGVDYVIALGHLGDDPASQPWTSEELIANTTGLDAFIDGHSHSKVEGKEVADKDGNKVLLTSTGDYFKNIGKMTITADGIKTELISAYPGSDADVAAIKNEWMGKVDTMLGEKIAYSEVGFVIKDETGRLIRKQETNLGDFVTDALIYLFRETEGLEVDVAIMNGGGIRADMPAGDISYKTTKTVHTFGNVACLQTVTGQMLLDALEWGARNVGTGENGGFLQVSGITYEIHSYIESTVQMDEKGVWSGAPTGEYRVKNVKVNGEPLDLTASYNLAGYNYTLRDLGDGFAMFKEAVNVKDYVMEDYMVLANYAKSFPAVDGVPTIKADNSVLGANYGDIYGEGRIKIVTEAPEDQFSLTSELKDGDKVVIYNAGNGKAFSSTLDGYYVTGVEVAPVENVIETQDASIIWDVTKNEDGSFTFTQGDLKLMVGIKDTHTNIYFEGEYADTWNIKSCNPVNNSFYIESATETTSFGGVYLEWYANKNAFSAYSTSSVDEFGFGFQFYTIGGTAVTPPAPEEQTFVKVTADQEDWSGSYIVVYENDATSAYVFTGLADADGNGVDAAIVDGKITTSSSNIIEVEKVDGGYTFKAAGGYMAGKAEANGTKFNTDPAVGTITWDAVKNIPLLTSDTGTIFRFNNGANYNDQTVNYQWFRFYKAASSVQTPVALYKLDDGTVTPPVTPPEGEDFVLANELKDGDEVIIVCAAKNIALSSTYNGFYNTGAPVTPVDGKINNADASIVWTVGKDGDNYTFSFNGQKLAMGASYSSMPLGEINDQWTISAALTEGAYYIFNVGREVYMEWYEGNSYWSGYYNNSNEELFAMHFYVKGGEVTAPCTHEWNQGEVTKEATCTENGVKTYTCTLCGATKTEVIEATGHNYVDGTCTECGEEAPKAGEYALTTELGNGSEVIIYHPASGNVLADTPNGNKIDSVAATPVDATLAAPEGAAIYTVEYQEGSTTNFYLRLSDGSYLTSGATGNALSYELAANEYSLWYLEVKADSDIVYVRSLNAAYNGNANQALEYYNGAFTTYGWKNNTAYEFQLYVKGGEAPCAHEWDEGAVTKAATCTENGEVLFTCTLCDATKTEVVVATGHNYVDNVCENCGDVYVPGAYYIPTELAVGDKIIFVVEHSTGFFALAKDTTVNNALGAAEVSVVDGGLNIGQVSENLIVWTVCAGSTEGTFTLMSSDGTYLNWGGSGTGAYARADATDLTVTCGEGTSVLRVAEDRSLGFRSNGGVPQFRFYKDENANGEYSRVLTIWKVAE